MNIKIEKTKNKNRKMLSMHNVADPKREKKTCYDHVENELQLEIPSLSVIVNKTKEWRFLFLVSFVRRVRGQGMRSVTATRGGLWS
jgi:hypothetical protein